MNKKKFNDGDLIYFASLGMFLCCIIFWFSGAKELANNLIVYVVLIGLGGIGLSKLKCRNSKKVVKNG